MNISATSRRPAALVALAVALLLAAVAFALVGGRPDTASADLNLNQNSCKGSIAAGRQDRGRPDADRREVPHRLCDADHRLLAVLRRPSGPVDRDRGVRRRSRRRRPSSRPTRSRATASSPGTARTASAPTAASGASSRAQFTIETPLCDGAAPEPGPDGHDGDGRRRQARPGDRRAVRPRPPARLQAHRVQRQDEDPQAVRGRRRSRSSSGAGHGSQERAPSPGARSPCRVVGMRRAPERGALYWWWCGTRRIPVEDTGT